jgi:hypothetical protein
MGLLPGPVDGIPYSYKGFALSPHGKFIRTPMSLTQAGNKEAHALCMMKSFM